MCILWISFKHNALTTSALLSSADGFCHCSGLLFSTVFLIYPSVQMLLDMITVRLFPQYCNNCIVSTYAFKNFKLHLNKAQLLKPM